MSEQNSKVGQFFAEITRHIYNEDYNKVLTVSKRVLELVPTDEKALQCKVAALVHLNKFDEAIGTINKCKTLDLSYERAYCEYRQNRMDAALAILSEKTEQTSRDKELMAQVLYKQEQYKECLSVYRGLMKNCSDDYDEERETNLGAVLASLATWAGHDPGDLGLREETFEMCYNAGCRLLGLGRYAEALRKLDTAEELCREMYDPEDDEDELEAELAPIRVQRGFCQQKLGHADEAMKLYSLVLKSKPSDVAVAAIASNNIITLNKDQNVFDSKKKIKTAMADGLDKKLTAAQTRTIALNHCLLLMYMNQGDQCKKTAQTLIQRYPDSETPWMVLAAQHLRERQPGRAVATLEDAVRVLGGARLTVTLAQLLVTQDNLYKACDVLKQLPDGSLRHSQGMVSALVSLYLAQGEPAAAAQVLQQAVTWRDQQGGAGDDVMTLLRAQGALWMKSGDPEQAAVALQDLLRRRPDDLRALAQLIAAYARFAPARAQEVARRLPPAEAGQGVDVTVLEAGMAALTAKYLRKRGEQPRSPEPSQRGQGQRGQSQRGQGQAAPAPAGLLERRRRRRRRKNKPPQHPEQPLDPERWVPRKERSYYRGKRRDKRKDVGKGTQGAASPSADFDASAPGSGGAGQAGSDVGSPRGKLPAGGGPRHQKPQGGKPKKKKKGGKW